VSAGTGAAPEGALIQQAHRLVAALVGLLSLLVAVAVWRVDPRPWMKGLALAAFALVVAQAVYGGIGVLNLLPPFFSVFHAAMAQLFLGVTIAMALFTSPGWLADRQPGTDVPPTARAVTRVKAAAETKDDGIDHGLRRWAIAATAIIYVQILLGALMRHSYSADGRPAGFAIPDYPLAFGRLIPISQLGSWATAIDFLHRVTALAALVAVGMVAIRVFRRHWADDALVRPAALLALVLLAQIALGGLTVLSGGHPAVSTTHAVAVTAALGAALVLALRSFRVNASLARNAASPASGDRKGAAE
jgi:cytochrome c oxidase assembly protein subunit 15